MAGVASTVVRGPFLLPASTWQEENADCGWEMRAGLEWHPSSKWDLYVYGGDEYYGRAAYVGRHNAVDKIVGWALLGNMQPLSEHVLMVSGRGGFEIVQKALAAGLPIVASVSAPSGLGVQLARELGLTWSASYVVDGLWFMQGRQDAYGLRAK